MRCTGCGREFDKGATIYRYNIYCPECAKDLDLILDEVESKVLRAVLENKPIPPISELLLGKKDIIEKLKLNPIIIEREVLSRVLSTLGRRTMP